MKKILIGILLLVFCPLHGFSFADTGPMETVGKGVVVTEGDAQWEIRPATNESDLNMESEIVNIYTYSDKAFDQTPDKKTAYATIEATFIIKNYEHEQDKMIGFPFSLEHYGIGGMYQRDAFDNFAAYIDGNRVDHSVTGELGSLSYSDWALWKTHFAANETKTISVEYTLTMQGGATGTLSYVLRTGALWKDKIKSAIINVDFKQPFSKERLLYVAPEGYTISNGLLTWKYHDFKPTEDIKITYVHDHAYSEHLRLIEEINKTPNLYIAHFNLALFYIVYGDYPNAQNEKFKELEKTISLKPDFSEAYRLAAEEYRYKGYSMTHYEPYNKSALAPLKKSIVYYEKYFILGPDQKSLTYYKGYYEKVLEDYNKIKNYKGKPIKYEPGPGRW